MSSGLETVLIITVLLIPWAGFLGLAYARDWDMPIGTSFVCALIFWLAVFVVCAIYGLVSESNSPDLVTLKKNEWQCVHTHQERRVVGKIWTTVDVCDTYQSIDVQ